MLPILPIRTQELLKGTTRDLMDRPLPTELGNQCWQSAGFPIPLLPEDLDLKGDEKKSGAAGGDDGRGGMCTFS